MRDTASAKLRFVRLSAQKARLVADQVRGLPVGKAIDVLSHSPKRAAKVIKKVLDSAIANADHNFDLDVDELTVRVILIDQGPTYKRIEPRAKGRACRILKPTSHVTVQVGMVEEQ